MPAYIKPNILPWSHYFAGFIELSSCCSVFFPPILTQVSICWYFVLLLDRCTHSEANQMYCFIFSLFFPKKQQYLNWKQITPHRWLRKHLLQVQFCKCQGRCCANCNQPGGPYRSVFQNF